MICDMNLKYFKQGLLIENQFLLCNIDNTVKVVSDYGI